VADGVVVGDRRADAMDQGTPQPEHPQSGEGDERGTALVEAAGRPVGRGRGWLQGRSGALEGRPAILM
jgi:hypothetical protein